MNYHNDGTLNNIGIPVIVSGFKSKAIQFDGVDDYISTGSLSDSLTGDLTFLCYLKTSTTKPGIIADIAREGMSGLKIGINADGNLYLHANEAGLSADLVSSSRINDGTWHFIALQRDSNTYRLYLDTATSIANGKGSIQTFIKLNVGAMNDGSSAFEGIIDEVKLYNSAIEEASFTRNMIPYRPLSLAVDQKDKLMKLTWIGQSNDEEGFVIERRTKDSVWQEHATIEARISTFTDTIELYNTQYSYRVRAFNKFGNSDPSNSVSVVSPLDTITVIYENDNANNGPTSFIYPNPVKTTFTLVSRINSSMEIFDISGRVMLRKNNLSGKEIIDIDQFPNGIYILKTCENEKINAIKIIKH